MEENLDQKDLDMEEVLVLSLALSKWSTFK